MLNGNRIADGANKRAMVFRHIVFAVKYFYVKVNCCRSLVRVGEVIRN